MGVWAFVPEIRREETRVEETKSRGMEEMRRQWGRFTLSASYPL
jgi:hypothetical protein